MTVTVMMTDKTVNVIIIKTDMTSVIVKMTAEFCLRDEMLRQEGSVVTATWINGRMH